jgi:hypothetical protein
MGARRYRWLYDSVSDGAAVVAAKAALVHQESAVKSKDFIASGF